MMSTLSTLQNDATTPLRGPPSAPRKGVLDPRLGKAFHDSIQCLRVFMSSTKVSSLIKKLSKKKENTKKKQEEEFIFRVLNEYVRRALSASTARARGHEQRAVEGRWRHAGAARARRGQRIQINAGRHVLRPWREIAPRLPHGSAESW